MMLKDISIRLAEQGDIDVNISVWQTTYRGIIHETVLNDMTPDSLRQKWDRTVANTTEQICYVAVLEKNVIGYVVCGKNRNDALKFDWELYAIYLLAEHQGKGVGKQLFIRAIEEMKKHKVHSFILFVLKENHATRKFYEAFKPDFQIQKTFELGGKEYQEIGYGWSDISRIR
jgi:L-amino acid N-acyltransferase YncA